MWADEVKGTRWGLGRSLTRQVPGGWGYSGDFENRRVELDEGAVKGFTRQVLDEEAIGS